MGNPNQNTAWVISRYQALPGDFSEQKAGALNAPGFGIWELNGHNQPASKRSRVLNELIRLSVYRHRRCPLKTLILVLAFAVGWILAAKYADADEAYSSVALGVFNSGKQSVSEEKFLNVGYRKPLGPFIEQVELGGWTDRAGGGRSGSAYGAYQLGFEVHGPILGRIATGPCLITSPDSYLGGVFQFTEDFFAGEEDAHGHSIGFLYKHISSAGLEQPNIGRDQMGFQIGLRF